MRILEKYILERMTTNILLCVLVFTSLILIVDFVDHLDDIIDADASFNHALQYFLFKIPGSLVRVLPMCAMVASLFTIGILAKNSELIAMQAAGMTVRRVARPIIFAGLFLSFFSLALNEFVVPFSNRRVEEIYNIDIKKKDERGRLNSDNFWWREGQNFFLVNIFDSRTNTLHELSKFEVSDGMRVERRTDAVSATFIDPLLGWSMENVTDHTFNAEDQPMPPERVQSLALPIDRTPNDFYFLFNDPQTFSFLELQEFIRQRQSNGLSSSHYLADLYAKISAPFVNVIAAILVIFFAAQPSRGGGMATAILVALLLGFSYHVTHSLCIALGRAEIFPPLLAAWAANILYFSVGGDFAYGCGYCSVAFIR